MNIHDKAVKSGAQKRREKKLFNKLFLMRQCHTSETERPESSAEVDSKIEEANANSV